MTRLNDLKNSISENQKPVSKQKRKRKLSLKTDFYLFSLVGIIVFLFLSLVAVAKTGIYQIPVFSQIFYKIPQPTRLVDIGDLASFNPDGFKFGKSQQEGLIFMLIPERELTYVLKRNWTNQPNSIFANNLQAVIEDGQIEFYGLLIKPITVNLTIKIKPYLSKDNKGLDYKVTKLKVGNLLVPRSLANFVVHYLVNKNKAKSSTSLTKTNSLVDFEKMKDKVKIQSFTIEDNKIHVIGWVDFAALNLGSSPSLSPSNLNKK
ncbi:MAG: hypothetical protein WCW26_00620 [Candidatus Buchananbacteria bacterium]